MVPGAVVCPLVTRWVSPVCGSSLIRTSSEQPPSQTETPRAMSPSEVTTHLPSGQAASAPHLNPVSSHVPEVGEVITMFSSSNILPSPLPNPSLELAANQLSCIIQLHL